MIYNAWSTPIEHKSSHVEGLVDHILTLDTTQINYTILEDDSKPINELKQVAYDNFKIYVNKNFGVDIDQYHTQMKAWVIAPIAGNFQQIHNHAGAMFSSVYYVIADENNVGGEIRFHDPRGNASRGYDKNFKHHFEDKIILPKTDDVLIFPSFLYHSVNPFSAGIRIAMPIDLYLFQE